jgi:hypothetical protein
MMGYSNDDEFSRAVMQVTGPKSRGRLMLDLILAHNQGRGVPQATANWQAATPTFAPSSAADGGGQRTADTAQNPQVIDFAPETGERGGIRTPDPMIKSHVL